MSSKFSTLFKGQRATLDAEHKAILEANRGAVWIHAASVGEFEQARTLIDRFAERQKTASLKDKRPIVVTFFSPSGYEARKNYDQVDAVLYLPFATRRKAKRFLDALQPSMAIFVKYEFWPAYLKELKKRAIPTYSISAIFRPTQRFFRWYGHASLNLLKCFTHIYVQDEASRRLLAEHGIHDCSVAGDTRFDRVKQIADAVREKTQAGPAVRQLTPVAQFVQGCERVIVAGSTWPKDEELLAQVMANDEWTNGEGCKLILVPHELDEEHLHTIFKIFEGRFVRYSAISGQMPEQSRLNILQRARLRTSSLYRRRVRRRNTQHHRSGSVWCACRFRTKLSPFPRGARTD